MVAVDRDVLNGPPPGGEVWTTLTWAAARTSTVTLVPNVLALPNRHPAMVAKMAETLDRLADGRLVLALGAGAAMNDANLHALGLNNWSISERVDAIAEAIDVIRGLWANTDFSYSGKHFKLNQANLQPKPERRIPIWLGAYRPRMLDLTGRSADGWIPSLFLLEAEAAYRALDRVRAAAVQGGRDPDALTYAYDVSVVIDQRAARQHGRLVGSAEQISEQLAEFVQHFTCLLFWLGGDTVTQMQRLARDVIPNLRDRAHYLVSSR